MSVISVTNPGAIRTFTQRATLRRWQRSPRFLSMKKEHALIPGAVCAHCGGHHGDQRYTRNGDPRLTPKGKPSLTHLTINHLSETLYLTEDLYLTWDPALMEVCCTVCNGWDRQGKEVCPVCKVNPISKDDPVKMCTACFLDAHPEVREQIEQAKESRAESKKIYNKNQAKKRKEITNKFPCSMRLQNQKCRNRNVGVCQYSAKTAPNCDHYKGKGGIES